MRQNDPHHQDLSLGSETGLLITTAADLDLRGPQPAKKLLCPAALTEVDKQVRNAKTHQVENTPSRAEDEPP